MVIVFGSQNAEHQGWLFFLGFSGIYDWLSKNNFMMMFLKF